MGAADGQGLDTAGEGIAMNIKGYPERIQAWMQPHFSEIGSWSITRYPAVTIEYVRADIAHAALEAAVLAERSTRPRTYTESVFDHAEVARLKAQAKFPQPNYVALKVAEEAGEVVRAAVHYAEGRLSWDELEGEVIQTIAMCLRLLVEGDQVNGIIPPAAIRSQGEKE